MVSDDKLPGILDLTPVNPAFNEDPHALYDKLRARCPVYRDAAAGSFVFTGHAATREVLSDNTMWRGPDRAEEAAVVTRALLKPGPPGFTIPVEERSAGILLMDEPDHMRIRGPLAKAFYKRIAKSKALIQQIVDGYLDGLAGRTTFDAVADYTLKLPIDVIAHILGVDNAQLPEFRGWSEGAIAGLNPLRSEAQTQVYVQSRNALSAHIHELMDARRRNPQDDLTSDMMIAQAEGAEISDAEIALNLIGLLVAGNLTSTDLIGNAIWLLLTHTKQLARLRADPSLIANTVEEALRHESPVEITGRVAPREMNVAGCPIHPRQSMIFNLRASNRDPNAFPDPHKFDITRKDAPHVAFGGGLHLCIGAPLGRLEAQVAILSFIQRFPALRLAHPAQKPKWRNTPFFHGLTELIVAV
ncbi:MAG TPA: cytochrome P450 [Rhizomicrobium sp.]|nr:cytochrome P450 [Rhizomicrobium sp.]